jgi:hypothetical protein
MWPLPGTSFTSTSTPGILKIAFSGIQNSAAALGPWASIFREASRR